MGGGKSNTTTSEFKPPKEFMDAYKEALAMARGPANKPYQQYTGQLVAGLSPTQQQGIANVNAAQGMALPAIQRGMQYTTEAARGITPELYNQFYSPYVRDVANTTFANLMESQAQQQSNLKGGAIQANAFGGDRSGVAASELARQQQLANAMAMSNIYQQGYTQATGLAGQQVANLGAMGQQLAGLGAGAQGSVLQGAQAQMAAGAQEQATEQARLQAAYDQWMQYQAYPYQQAQFFANIAQGLGAGAGGSSSTTAPAPNLGSQILGGVGAIGSIYSDKRMKENIQAVGKLNDGQTVYRYNFKGDPKTQIGLLAQEVEESKPGAVTQVKGLKMVDYKGATEDAAEMSSIGGVVMPSSDRQGLAGGGIPYYPYGNAIGYVPEGKINIRSASIPDAPKPYEDEGLAAGWQDIKPLSQSQIGGLRQMASDLGLDLPEKKSAEDNGDGEDNEPAPGLFSGLVRSLRGNAANGGVAARGHYADGGLGVAPSQEEDQDYGPEAVESVPIEGLGAASEVLPDEVVVPEESDGVAAAATPEDQAPPFVIPGEKPRSGLGGIFDIKKAFASEENPSLIERVMGRRLSPEARSAVMNASFALMAGRSPFFFTNLGEAGKVGTQTYYNALQQQRELAKQQADIALTEQERETQRMNAETARVNAARQLYAQMLPQIRFWQMRNPGKPLPPEYQRVIDAAYPPSATTGVQAPPSLGTISGPSPIAPAPGIATNAPETYVPSAPAIPSVEGAPEVVSSSTSGNSELDALYSQLPDEMNPNEWNRIAEDAMTIEDYFRASQRAAELTRQYQENGIPLPGGVVPFPGSIELQTQKTGAEEAKKSDVKIVSDLSAQMSDMQSGFSSRTMIVDGLRESLSTAETGKFAEIKTDIVNAMNTFGLANADMVEEAADLQTAMKYFAQSILDSGMKDKIGPQISNADLILVAQGQGTIENLPAANRRIIGAMYGKLMYDKAKAEAWDDYVSERGGIQNISATDSRQWQRKFGEENPIGEFTERGIAETPVAGELSVKRKPEYFKEGFKYVDPKNGRIFIVKGFQTVNDKTVPVMEYVQ